MKPENIISDQKSSLALIGALIVLLIAILTKESVSEILNYSVIGISLALPLLTATAFLLPLTNAIKNKSLNHIYIFSYAVGHFSGLFSLACVFFHFSIISGIVFIVVSISVIGFIAYILEYDKLFKAVEKHHNENNA